MVSASLPLFDEPASPRRMPSPDDRHLQAARQLSRRIGRFRDQSPEQLRAGHLICRHLIAMLEASAVAEKPAPH
jgi:hypothetical protein